MIQSTAVKTSQNLHLLQDPEESDRPHCGHFVLQEAVVYSHPRRQIQIKILI